MSQRRLSDVRAEADRWFARLVKLRAADEQGYVRCVTCGRSILWDSLGLQAGHFRRRWMMATRYDEMNVHPQCLACNYFGDEANLRDYMVRTYGQAAVDDLVRRSHELASERIEDYERLIERWKRELVERGDLAAYDDGK